MIFQPRIVTSGSGAATSALLPRMGVGHGEALWPRCTLCRRAVSAYGLGEHVPGKYIEIWVRCDGIADPYGGAHVRSYRSGVRVDLTRFREGWTRNTSVDILSRIAIVPGKFGKWNCVMKNPDTVVPA